MARAHRPRAAIGAVLGCGARVRCSGAELALTFCIDRLRNRMPYIGPLNHLQVELLRRRRSGDTHVDVKRGMLISINGIAAGLRNSG